MVKNILQQMRAHAGAYRSAHVCEGVYKKIDGIMIKLFLAVILCDIFKKYISAFPATIV